MTIVMNMTPVIISKFARVRAQSEIGKISP